MKDTSRLKKLFQHLLQIQVVLEFPNQSSIESRFQLCTVSACVIEVRGCWFLLSAGHLVTELKEFVFAKNARIETCKLLDCSSIDRDWPPIPFPIFDTAQQSFFAEGVPHYSIHEESGADFLFIGLRQNEIDLLTAGGVIALSESFWKACPETVSRYYLVGLPTSLRSGGAVVVSRRLRVDGEHTAIAVPVEPCVPPTGFETDAERFYAKVPLISNVLDGKAFSEIEGMSGGPIFACRNVNDSEVEYFLLAVQSGWFKSDRVITACPLKPLVNLIAEKVDAHILNALDASS